MALIDCKISRDASGNTAVTYTIQRIDPGDELNLITDKPNAALKWTNDPPFDSASVGELYPLPQLDAAMKPLKVVKLMAFSTTVAECGDHDGKSLFTPWPGAGFPDPGSKQQKGN